ncbi:MAG: ABC transporter substrate-binding protein [Firmicutes bacterium]|nr:ABC transporter substrate-binding protein [Bacillota bacterium]
MSKTSKSSFTTTRTATTAVANVTSWQDPAKPSSGFSRREFLRRSASAAALLAAPATVFGTLARAAVARPVKIGAIGSLTGAVSVWGRVLRDGAQLAVDQINRSGGILGRPVELIVEDDASAPDVGTRRARKLTLEDRVDVLIGVNHSGVLLSILEQLPALNKVLICSCATTAEATVQRFNKYIFRVHSNSDQEGMAGARYAAQFPYRRWSVIAPNYSYGYETWGAFISVLKQLRPDIEILDIQAWPPFGAPDFTSHITRLRAARPDAVLSAMWGGDAVNLLRQMQRFRFLDRVALFSPAALALDVLYALGEEVPENVHSNAHGYWFETPKAGREAANRTFVETYYARFGEYPHSTAHATYAAVWTFKKAAELAGTTETAELIAALEGIEVDFPGLTGYLRAEDHQVVHDMAWGRTAAAPDLPFRRRLTDMQWASGEEITPSVDDVLKLRKSGERPGYYRYIVGA